MDTEPGLWTLAHSGGAGLCTARHRHRERDSRDGDPACCSRNYVAQSSGNSSSDVMSDRRQCKSHLNRNGEKANS